MLKLFHKTPIIEFYCEEQDFGVIPPPKESGKFIPEWYKKVKPQLDKTQIPPDMFGQPTMTAKKCNPLLDALTLGWIIPSWGDVTLMATESGKILEKFKEPNGEVVEFHVPAQVSDDYNMLGVGRPLKWLNKWIIKTAPGYSVLITPPLNHMGQYVNKHFTCLSAVVDTDVYHNNINFPAIWHTPGIDIHIPAGTPLVQIIPFKRDDLNIDVKPRVITKKEKDEKTRIIRCISTRSRYYANELRCPR